MEHRKRFVKHLSACRYREPIEVSALPLALAAYHKALTRDDVRSRAELVAGALREASVDRSLPDQGSVEAIERELIDGTRSFDGTVSIDGTVSLDDLAVGAGFDPIGGDRYRWTATLPDVVGPGLRLLVIGLNPSPASTEAGVGFARPGNRFWPAALGAGVASVDRDPLHALQHHGVGFTDLAKRTTRRAAELDPSELRSGFGRVERLCRWLRPGACVMVGLLGWRTAVDRRAVAGWQAAGIGGIPVYVMPSTSGLNAHSSLADLTAHLAAAIAHRPASRG
jgi:TDG/mug DNA glycosylase family protein